MKDSTGHGGMMRETGREGLLVQMGRFGMSFGRLVNSSEKKR